MTEILMAILMIAIGVITTIATEGDSISLLIFSILAGSFFLYDTLKEMRYGRE